MQLDPGDVQCEDGTPHLQLARSTVHLPDVSLVRIVLTAFARFSAPGVGVRELLLLQCLRQLH